MKLHLEHLRAWWSSLAERERRVLAGGGVALALIVVYAAVYEPLVGAHQQRRDDLAAARAVAMELERLSAVAPGGGPALSGAGQSLLAIVDQSRQASGIAKPPSRLQPEGEATVRIWLEDVPFEALMRWLGDLQTRYGVRVEAADIQRESGPGLVNARLTLMRG
jgi:general secretion pathway protein M